MKKLTLLLAALFAAGVYAECLPCASAQEETKPAETGKQVPHEKAKTDVVTFHVIGMKKTASGAT